MEYLTTHTWQHKLQRRTCWHRWFAWFPVTVHTYPDGAKKKAWLQWVLRKGEFHMGYGDDYWTYEYKEFLHE